MAECQCAPANANDSQPGRLSDPLANGGRQRRQRDVRGEEERRCSIDSRRRNPEVGCEAVRLRISEIASIETIEDINHGAKRQEQQAQFAVKRSMVGLFFRRDWNVPPLARLLQVLLDLLCGTVIYDPYGLGDIRSMQRLPVLGIGWFTHVAAAVPMHQGIDPCELL